MQIELLLRNAKLVDGTGAPWKAADIGLSNGRIVAISGAGEGLTGNSTIDVGGRFVTPGFVNIHSHLDFSILGDPGMESAVLQGITSELGGQCGQSIAPTDGSNPDYIKEFYRNHWHGYDLDWKWTSLGDFLNRLTENGISINFGMQVGHQTLRLITMGFECRAASDDELEKLKGALTAAMRDGAFGLSCGIQWAPGFFCETPELVELGKIAAQYGGFLAFHMRSEGDMMLESVAEVIEIGDKAKVPVQISHLKAAGRQNFGKVHGALRMIAAARKRGIDVLADTQPYGALDKEFAAENMWMRSCIPPWFLAETGGFKNLQVRLSDPAFRESIRRDVEEKLSPFWHSRIVDCMFNDVGWDGLVLGTTDSKVFEKFVGRSIAEISEERGSDPYTTYFDILQEEPIASGALYFMMDPEDVRAVVTSEYTIPQVDAAPRHNHPRKHGCFAHYLQHYVRNGGELSLEGAVRKITSFPAARMGLTNRGLVKEGFWADLCIFDLNKLEDHTDFEHNTTSPTGFDYVFVNGVIVVKEGRHTGARPGTVLRGRGFSENSK